MSKQLEEIEIYLLDRDEEIVECWKRSFEKARRVNIVCQDFADFMKTHSVECVVSPANAYGLMDGGYDLAITEWFGWDLQKKVQQYIVDNLYGEQPVGTSIIVDTDRDGIKLIHTPTMRYPERIRDPQVVYHCMRTCLMTAMQNDIGSMVIPAFGGLTGGLAPYVIADMMWRAYWQLFCAPSKLDWIYAEASRIDR